MHFLTRPFKLCVRIFQVGIFPINYCCLCANRHGASVGRAGVLSQRAGAAGGGACVSAELEGSRAEGEQSGGGPATQTPHHRLRRLHCATLVHGWRVRG